MNMPNEKRKMKVIFNKAGGNAGRTSVGTRISLPKTWIDKMNITPEEREVLLSFKNKKITIEKIERS